MLSQAICKILNWCLQSDPISYPELLLHIWETVLLLLISMLLLFSAFQSLPLQYILFQKKKDKNIIFIPYKCESPCQCEKRRKAVLALNVRDSANWPPESLPHSLTSARFRFPNSKFYNFETRTGMQNFL